MTPERVQRLFGAIKSSFDVEAETAAELLIDVRKVLNKHSVYNARRLQRAEGPLVPLHYSRINY